jgi:hypothetical protein
MSVASGAAAPLSRALPAAGGRARPLVSSRIGWWAALAGVLVIALLLRLWGIKQGLPVPYNTDEADHFVPRAIGMFAKSLNPHYYANPPGFTYLLYVVFKVWFGSGAAAAHTLAVNPTEVYELARVVVAVLGMLTVWVLYLAGSRLVDRRTGLLAALLLAVAFLPVFYAHLALNDDPTLLPATIALLGAAGVLRNGRPVDYLLAGVGLGLGCALKYTAGIMLLPLLAAFGAQFIVPGGDRSALAGLAIAAVAALLAFVAANPFSVLDFSAFEQGLIHQSSASDDGVGKLGTTQSSGYLYYLWAFTWGLGWVPSIASILALPRLWRDERRLVWVLAPAPIIYLLVLGGESRYFGRWLLPIFPIVCILAAYGVLEAADWLARRRPLLRPTLLAVAVVGLCAQPIVSSIHSGLVDSRADTRNITRAWMVAHIYPGSNVVVEPTVPFDWLGDIGHTLPVKPYGYRWDRWFTTVDHRPGVPPGTTVNIENYETTLWPGLIALYEQAQFCWVITGSTQMGRAFAQPDKVPQAVAYYQALAREGKLVFTSSPYSPGATPPPFNFDWTFDYYPSSFQRPGQVMQVYRLGGGNCAYGADGGTPVL